MEMPDQQQHHAQSSRSKWVLAGFLVVAAYFLWMEHRAHVIEFLPYLLLLACPLMHLFHHHGHGEHHRHDHKQTSRNHTLQSTQERDHE